jgi:hypothetical protein
MSKKSRRRNKKILATIAALGGAAMLANRRRNNMINSADANEGFVDTEFKVQDVAPSKTVTTKNTIMDSMPAKPKKNPLSKRITEKGEVYTIKGASEGVPKKIGNKKSMFVGDNYIYQDGKPYTKGRFGTFAARNKKPAMLSPDRTYTPPVQDIFTGSGVDNMYQSARKGGRIVKGKKTAIRTGAAKRGFGRAFLKGGKK